MATSKELRTRRIVIVIYSILYVALSEENIALRKVAIQKDAYQSYWAGKAVDGCLDTHFGNGCCSHTSANQITAWWRVDLGQLSIVKAIRIYFRTKFPERVAGYQIYVTNSSEHANLMGHGILVYSETSRTSDEVQTPATHTGTYTTRYVTIYNHRETPKRHNWYSDKAFLEICEVQVFGCIAGKYGRGDCSQTCSMGCFHGTCDPTSGVCLYGCVHGKYGDKCEDDCSTSCLNNDCDKTTGYCYDCISGKYGSTCEYSCSSNCLDTTCDKIIGRCFQCVAGFHGNTCNEECPASCSNSLCDMDTGMCYSCNDGFHSPLCVPCPIGCSNSTCDTMYGNCSRCIAGYYSNTCREECPANCTDGLCTMDTGICYACVPGYYGNKCSEKCGHCKGGSCDKDTGKCMTLCEDGYAGDKCDVEVIYRYISRTGNSCGHTTLSVGLGCGVAILALLLVIIVQAKRKHSQRQTDDCPIANVGLKDIEKFLQPETVDIQDVLVPL